MYGLLTYTLNVSRSFNLSKLKWTLVSTFGVETGVNLVVKSYSLVEKHYCLKTRPA